MSTCKDRLEQFFGGYFHQDWRLEGAATWRDVIKQYGLHVPRSHAVTIRNDLQGWLNESANDESEERLGRFGCEFDPRSDGLTEQQWVSEIVAEFDCLLRG